MRHTRAHTANRRSHHAIKTTTLGTCKDCNAPKEMHKVCTHCGRYKGRVIIDVVKGVEKSQAKNK